MSLVLAVVGVVMLLALKGWAYGASRASHGKSGDVEVTAVDRTTFRRRLMVYYGASLLFIAAWAGHAILLRHRAAELQTIVDAGTNSMSHP